MTYGTAVPSPGEQITLFLCGDVMIGRGIDQALPHPSDPTIHESYVTDARSYLQFAERANGPIQRPITYEYLWGDGLEVCSTMQADARIINLETSITRSPDYWPAKGINYRMHPQNIPALTVAGIDLVALANNHTLDYGYEGLAETTTTLRSAGLQYAGAGADLREAEAPAIIELESKGRVVLFSLGSVTSGIPPSWEASPEGAGVHLINDLSRKTALHLGDLVRSVRREGDIVIASIHWGSNWGYRVSQDSRNFAHMLVDDAGFDLIHGHSSHHVRPLELYGGKLIIYGCGDFINDYEGIGGHEEYRGDLRLMFFATLDRVTREIVGVRIVPLRAERFRLLRAMVEDSRWLEHTLNRISGGTRFELHQGGGLVAMGQ